MVCEKQVCRTKVSLWDLCVTGRRKLTPRRGLWPPHTCCGIFPSPTSVVYTHNTRLKKLPMVLGRNALAYL